VPIAQESDARNRYGNWIREEELGSGGQGVAYLARNGRTGRLGALKVLLPDRKKSEKAFARFRHEVEALQEFEHPCILKLLDSNLEAEEPWAVTEFLTLGSLDKVLQTTAGDTWRTLRLARDIATALAEAHAKGIIHRDVKPKNIFLRSLDQAVLGDFGIAHDLDATQLTSTEENVGAHWFRPPEAEDGRIDDPPPNFDVYSLGKVIYVRFTCTSLVAFRQPRLFYSRHLPSIRACVSEDSKRIKSRCYTRPLTRRGSHPSHSVLRPPEPATYVRQRFAPWVARVPDLRNRWVGKRRPTRRAHDDGGLTPRS
jgi:serine/threonine protein kinase